MWSVLSHNGGVVLMGIFMAALLTLSLEMDIGSELKVLEKNFHIQPQVMMI